MTSKNRNSAGYDNSKFIKVALPKKSESEVDSLQENVSEAFRGYVEYKNKVSSLEEKVSELEKTLDFMNKHTISLGLHDSRVKELERTIVLLREHKAQDSKELQSAREVISMYADVENWFDTGHRIINSDVEIVSGHEKYNGMSFGAGGKRAREWMKSNGM